MNLRKPSKGVAVLEFAAVIFVLLVMSYPVFDYFRAIQTILILVNVSREGANLAARTSYTTPQAIMDQLAATTPPLAMDSDGMIYLTKVMGQRTGTVVNNVVLEQYRWQQGWQSSHYTPASPIWNCGANGSHWATGGATAGTCLAIPSASRPPAALGITLADGEVVYAVDVFYHQPSLFGFGSSLMSLQVLPDDFHAQTVM